MNDFLAVIIIFAVYILLMKVVLPRMGVPT